MKNDNMKNAVAFTFFSFLLLTITTFLVFYRYDLYNADTTFIRIGFIVGDSRNETEKNKDVKPKIQTSTIRGGGDSEQTIAHKDRTPQDVPTNPPVANTHFYDKFLAILATRSLHPEENGGTKPSLGEEIITQKTLIEDPVEKTIFRLAKPKEPSMAPERISDSIPTQSAVENSSVRSKFKDPEVVIVDNRPSIPAKPAISAKPAKPAIPAIPSIPAKPSEKTSTKLSGVQDAEADRQVASYPAERLPTPVSSTSPSRSWPSLFLPDSGFANSAEISPFSLFSRIADFLGSDEDKELQTHDLPKMWPGVDDFTDFFSPRKRFLQGYSFGDWGSKNNDDSYGDYY